MTTLALFGTSADPPTAGHQQILRQLSYQYDQVIAWASDNPLKTDQTPLAHRAAMLQLLVSNIEPRRTNIQCRQDLSYPRTLHTIEQVRQEWPDVELTLVVGADLIQQLPCWYQVQALLQHVKLLVVPRQNYVIHPEDIDRLRQLGTDVAIANFEGLPVSSTAYRQAQQQAQQHIQNQVQNQAQPSSQPSSQQQTPEPISEQPNAEPAPSSDDALSSALGIIPPVHAYIVRERLYTNP